MTPTLTVRLPRQNDRSYPIFVRSGMLLRLPGLLRSLFPGREVFLVSDSTVARLYGARLRAALVREGMPVKLVDFPDGEKSKSLDVVRTLYDALLSSHVRRRSIVVALGGGVTGDLAGFVAATILRGIEFVQVPTTLLAQVDSSVGGKVGVDHALGKNLIGAFHQPAAVCIDPGVLRTLPVRHFRSGLAEVVKIAAALDASFFGNLERRSKDLRRTHVSPLGSIITRAIALKSAVVERDEREAGLRATLNLGHTIGHAVEAASGYRVIHGEAVSIGLAAEAWISRELGILAEADFHRLLRLLSALGLPTRLPVIRNIARFRTALSSDKKSDAGVVRFVLLSRIGESAVGVVVPPAIIERLLRRAG